MTTGLCHYCGRKIAKNRRPYTRRGFYANGQDWIGHRSCFMEMGHPEDSRLGHERHDIKVRN